MKELSPVQQAMLDRLRRISEIEPDELFQIPEGKRRDLKCHLVTAAYENCVDANCDQEAREVLKK